ncbi:MAG TPA: hypothetical protein VF170_08045 [Planctomycetaceae bacterium]
MVREARLLCDVEDRRFEPPVCRDSVLDEESPAERPRKPVAKRKAAGPRAAAKPAPPARPATERRHLAGADWLSDFAFRPRVAK